MHKLKYVIFGLDLQVPGHASGWEPQPGQQDCDRPELRGSSPECAQGENKNIHLITGMLIIILFDSTVPLLSSVQYWRNQPSCHLDRHWNPFQGVGHSGQWHLVCQKGTFNNYPAICCFSLMSLQLLTTNSLHLNIVFYATVSSRLWPIMDVTPLSLPSSTRWTSSWRLWLTLMASTTPTPEWVIASVFWLTDWGRPFMVLF